jgi:site-specific DNA-methyltransferase (adenine-specific)
MKVIENNSVHLIVTSPPYYGVQMWGNLNEELLGIKNSWWENEKISKLKRGEKIFNDYLMEVWRECYRVLVPGGRLIIDVADTPSKAVGYWDNHLELMIRAKKVGFRHRDMIYWQKGNQHKVSGSYPRPWGILIANTVEYVIVLQKPGVRDYSNMSNKLIESSKMKKGCEQWVLNPVWEIKSASAKHEGHCAPFPLELVKRLISLYTYKYDIVLDPYCGTGTTLKAAKLLKRNFIGVELYEKYFKQISKKVGWNEQTLYSRINYQVRKFKSRVKG